MMIIICIHDDDHEIVMPVEAMVIMSMMMLIGGPLNEGHSCFSLNCLSFPFSGIDNDKVDRCLARYSLRA